MSSGRVGRRANAAHVVFAGYVNRLLALLRAVAGAARGAGRSSSCKAISCRLAFCAWALLVAASLTLLARYSGTPGPDAMPPPLSAAGIPLESCGTRHLLIMAIHPRCPCSRASIGELTRLLTWHRDELRCAVLLYQPDGVAPGWSETDIAAPARQLPHTKVLVDTDGRYAGRLGIRTSGAVVLYSPLGKVEFYGGITPARGHWGDNLGSDAIVAILAGDMPLRRSAPAYGCLIQ